VTYLSQAGTLEEYEKVFTLSPGQTFEDDFSTPTREHVFTATATSNPDGVVINFDYFSDVSALATIELDSDLSFAIGQDFDKASGRHWYYHSASGSYSVVYLFTATLLDSVLPGDIDGDGDVDAVDQSLFVSVLLGADIDPLHVNRSDLNADGVANGADVEQFVIALLGG